MQGPRQIVVVGAGGFGRETLDVLQAVQEHDSRSPALAGVVDTAPSPAALYQLRLRGVPYLGTVEDWIQSKPLAMYLLAISDPAIKARLAYQLEQAGLKPAMAIHPRAGLGTRVLISPGVVICAGAEISTGVTLQAHVHINPNATIGHEVVLGKYSTILPGAVISGNTVLKEGVLVGAGAVVLQGLTLGPRSTVGAAACVTKSTAADTTSVGIPARAR